MTDKNKITDFEDRYRLAEEGESDWYKQAKEDKDFYWNRMWAGEEKSKLKKEGRPSLTYNEIRPTVDLVAGTQRQNRLDLKAFHRAGGSENGAKILTVLLKDIENQSNFPFHGSKAFHDGLIRGKGYIGLDIDYSEDILNGNIKLKRLPPFRVKIDPNSETYDPNEDADFIFEESWHTRKKLKLTYPEKADELDFITAEAKDKELITASYKKDDYGSVLGSQGKTTDIDRYKLKVKTCWYKTYEKTKFLFNEMTGEINPVPSELSKEDLEAWLSFQRKLGVNWTIIDNVIQPVLRVATYVGNVLLQDIERPLGKVNKFPIIPYYAYFDDDECSGMVTALKDPNREINKRYSQFLHILNTSANTGWMIEEGSVRDENVYKRFGAKAGVILKWMRGRTKPEKIVPTPISHGHILAKREGSDEIKKISGVSIDLLGQVGARGEPGIVLQLRQRQGNIVIEQLYDNWRYTRKLMGQLLIDVIQKARTYTQEEILNIIGREKLEIPGIQEDIGRVMNDLNVGRYEIKIDLTPTSPTVKIANFTALAEAAKAGLPIPVDILIEAYPELPKKEKILERLRQAPPEGAPEGAQIGGLSVPPTGTPEPI